MNAGKLFAAVALAVAATTGAHAAATPDPGWTRTVRANVLARVSALLSNYYYVDRVAAMRSAIAADRTALLDIDDEAAFAKALTADLQKASRDQHLIVWYSQRPDANTEHRTTPAEAAEMNRFFDFVNEGVDAAVHLKGNVGYLRVGGFADLPAARPTIDAAMLFVRHSGALIVDLRHNGGGDSDTVTYLLSFFVPHRTELSAAIQRHQNQTIVDRNFTSTTLGAPRYLHRPVFVVVDRKTISGSEMFAYEIQALHAATIVGEQTAGAGDGLGSPPFFLTDHLRISIPDTIIRNPRTGTSWDRVGVSPDVDSDGKAALVIAYTKALALVDSTYDPVGDLLQARSDPARALHDSLNGE